MLHQYIEINCDYCQKKHKMISANIRQAQAEFRKSGGIITDKKFRWDTRKYFCNKACHVALQAKEKGTNENINSTIQ